MAHCTYGCDGCVHHSTPHPGYSVLKHLIHEVCLILCCASFMFFGQQSLSDTRFDDLLLEWELVLKS